MGGLRLWKNRFKYFLLLGLTFIYPLTVVLVIKELSGLYNTRFALTNIALLLLLYILVKRNRISIGKFFSRVISGNVNSCLGVFTIIVFFIALSMSTDKFMIWLERDDFNSITLAAIYLLAGINTAILFILSQSYFYKEGSQQYDKPEQKKVLIVALSRFGYVKGAKGDRETFLKEIRDNKLDESKCTWAIPFRSIKHHIPKLEKVIVLVSSETDKEFNNFKAIWEEFQKYYNTNKIKLIKSNPVNFNSLQDCLHELHRLLRVEVFPKYKDEDISMNISSGTAIVSAAMIIASVKEGRQVEYIEQTNTEKSKLLSVNVSVQDIYYFYPELKG